MTKTLNGKSAGLFLNYGMGYFTPVDLKWKDVLGIQSVSLFDRIPCQYCSCTQDA